MEQGVLVRPEAVGTTGRSLLLTKPLTALQLPPTVQGVLAARIDRQALARLRMELDCAMPRRSYAYLLLKCRGIVSRP